MEPPGREPVLERPGIRIVEGLASRWKRYPALGAERRRLDAATVGQAMTRRADDHHGLVVDRERLHLGVWIGAVAQAERRVAATDQYADLLAESGAQTELGVGMGVAEALERGGQGRSGKGATQGQGHGGARE